MSLTASLAFAQGSGSTAGNAASSDDFKVTRSVEGKIAQVTVKDNLFVVEDKTGDCHSFHFTDETKIASAKSDTDKTSSKVSDLKAGKKVKVVFRASDSQAVRVKLLD